MRISRRFAASTLIAGLIGLAATLAGPAGAASASEGNHRIGDYDAKTFATVSTFSNQVTMQPPSSSTGQVWLFTQNSLGAYKITSRLTGGCLAVATASPSLNPPIVQRPCQGTPSEHWQLVRTSSVHVAFRSVGAQGRCIGVDRNSTPARLLAYPCNYGSPLQQFRLS